MIEKFKISVITPSLNSATYLEEAIQSVVRQNYANCEHIIVDGGSTDGTLEIISKYSHLKWISEKDKGQSDAMNKGFGMSSGDIIVYLNADDYFADGVFHDIAAEFEEGHKFVVGNVLVAESDGKTWLNDPKVEFRDMIRWWEHNSYCYNPLGYFYLREVQEKIGFNLANHYAMDVEFILQAALSYKFRKIDKVLGTFRLVPGTKTHGHSDYESFKNNMAFCDKLAEELNQEDKKSYFSDLEGYYDKLKKQNNFSYKIYNLLKNKILNN